MCAKENITLREERGTDMRDMRMRDSMLVLPHWLQPLLTWLTTIPYSGESPRKKSSAHHVIVALSLYLFGMISSIGILEWRLPLVFLIFSWMLTVSGARTLQVQIIHQAAHETLSSQKWVNDYAGMFLSAILLVNDFNSYKIEHLRHHAANILATKDDDTFRFLFNVLGFKPGMTKKQLWRRLLLSLISPNYHLHFLWLRLAPVFRSASISHSILAITWVTLLLYITAVNGTWLPLAFVWAVPMILLYQISAGLRLCVEHRYTGRRREAVSTRVHYAELTWAILPGEPIPGQAATRIGGLISWGCWVVRILVIHLPSRVFVLVGDTPSHDYHHRYPTSPNWPNFIAERRADFEADYPKWGIPYNSIWGLFAAIDAALDCIASAQD